MISSHSITMISLVISPWWWVRGDYPKKHFRRVNDWNLPRSSQIYPALIIPFYIPFYISPIRWILYRYTNIPKIYPILYISPRYPQFHAEIGRFGLLRPPIKPKIWRLCWPGLLGDTPWDTQKTVLVGGYVMWFMWFMWGYFTYIYIYVGGFQICYMV